MHHNGLLQLCPPGLPWRTTQPGDIGPLDQSGTSSGELSTNQMREEKIMGFRAPPADTVFMLVNEMMSCKIIHAAPSRGCVTQSPNQTEC